MTESVWLLAQLADLAAPDDDAIAIGPFGSSLKSHTYVAEGVPVVRGANLVGSPGFQGDFVFVEEETAARLSRCLVQPGDLVFPHRGAIGAVGLAIDEPPGKWLLSTSMMKFRPNPERLDPRYAFHFFRSDRGRHELLKNASQVGTPGIGQPLASLRACQIPIPPIDEQRTIASILSSLDDKIHQNRRTELLLERLALAIFRAWFVDFEPVKAKAAGATSFPAMRQAVFDTLPSLLADSGPEGWEVKALSDLFEVNPPRPLRKGEPAPYIDMKNMPTEGHSPNEVSVRPSGSGAKFTNGDTLVARITPCLENGKTAYVDFLSDGEIAWGSTEYIVLRPRPPIPPIFAYLLARTSEFRSFAIQAMTGTSGRQRVPFSTLDHFSIPTPPADILAAFGELVEPLIARSSAATRESRALARLRDLLLPRLLSGELRVSRGDAR